MTKETDWENLDDGDLGAIGIRTVALLAASLQGQGAGWNDSTVHEHARAHEGFILGVVD